MKYSLAMKWIIIAVPVVCVTAYVALTQVAPPSQSNLCVLFKQHPSWYWSAHTTQEKWGVPISVQMAIIRTESHFRADAKPPHKKLLGFIPWVRQTSAEGYAQAVDATWKQYLTETHQASARRSSFAKSTDFVGWYADQVHRHLGIAKSDAAQLYLAYYLGMGGYQEGRYKDNPWLMGVAKRVGAQQAEYHQQLVTCEGSLSKRPWWHVWG